MNSRASNPNCTLCGGWGWAYVTPPIELRGTISSYDMRRDAMELATLAPGDVILSVEPRTSYIVADYDKVILPRLEQGEPFSGELVQRAIGSYVDRLRFPIVVLELVSTVNTSFVPTFYVNGTDFSYSGDAITWNPNGNNPAPGAVYSVRYRARYEWIAFAPPSSRHARGSGQGQRVLLRRRDMTPLTNAAGVVDPAISQQ